MSKIRPKPEWQVEKDNSELAYNIDSELRQVMDPELGLNVMELGLIRDVNVMVDAAHIIMIMTTPFCPYAPALLESTRAAVEKVVELPTTIEMGMEIWDPTFMEEGTGSDWGLF